VRVSAFSVSFMLCVVLTACSKPPVAAQKDAAMPVETARATALGSTAFVNATGKIERERAITLSFRSGGIIQQLTVDNGDAVRAGQLIASIDPTEIDARVRRADADYDKAKRDVTRDSELAAQGWVSGQRLADRKSVLQSSRANLDAAQFDMKRARIYASTAGVVLVRHVQVGETAAPGQPIITMADMSAPLVIKVALADKDVARVKLGDPARISVAALNNLSLAGVVTQIGQQADPRTGATDVEIRLPNERALKTGFVADARITLRDVTGNEGPLKLKIPAEALLEINAGRGHVFVVDPTTKKAKRMAIEFYGFDGDDALVGGLQPNQKVITFGATLVRDGMVIADNSPGA
jgi:membrane fusion protein, multidrug efflux system